MFKVIPVALIPFFFCFALHRQQLVKYKQNVFLFVLYTSTVFYDIRLCVSAQPHSWYVSQHRQYQFRSFKFENEFIAVQFVLSTNMSKTKDRILSLHRIDRKFISFELSEMEINMSLGKNRLAVNSLENKIWMISARSSFVLLFSFISKHIKLMMSMAYAYSLLRWKKLGVKMVLGKIE